ncbi:patatin-like phospholipase family protein [Sphingopyxis sp.]|uniref:patatin-like phospholipase family protein n=1 Tax=Sphingopyxis sp. TaxID=1908224 RepID=UPI002D778645|nr:patatin-like phospholipase family protein [Sphingopyxis sp.]HET6523184.1 patatin-like phospholipase family protein [Sphingopyxis sp.]
MTAREPGAIGDPIFGTGVPDDGVGLCLSGGGYRAMLFHVGTLWRLMEADKLFELTRISSVSGGSITAGVLALAWDGLKSGGMAAFREDVVEPLRGLARVTIDERSILGGLFLPGSIAQYVANSYAKHLFGDRTLQDLPEAPVFVINATNLETGSLFRFMRSAIRDWRVGRIAAPTVRIADAVAASSAFPPILSPFILDVDPADFDPPAPGEIADDAFRNEISLSDGGVYDNLGLQQVWARCKTVLVSDGGGHIADNAAPPGDWARQSLRVLEVIDQQVRNLRMLQVVGSLESKERFGAFWSARTNIAAYDLADALPCPYEKTARIAAIPTRLRRMDDAQQERLINWGYAVADAGMRRYWMPSLSAPAGFPYPGTGIG